MNVILKLFAAFIFLLLPLNFVLANDSLTKNNVIRRIALRADYGDALKTNDFISSENFKHGLKTYNLKYTFQPTDIWHNYLYHQSYNGIGISFTDFQEKRLGYPFSIFLVQGGRIARLHEKLWLMYEFNLGYSANWRHYDRFTNPENITIGSNENIHIGGGIYLDWALSKKLNLRLGGGVIHFSNGATKMPNKGLNAVSANIELAYKLNEAEQAKETDINLVAPEFKKHIDHEFTLTISSRQKYYDTTGTNLPTQFVNNKYRVIETSYSPMFASRHKYKWGPSVNILYDESSNSYAKREYHSDGNVYERIIKGKMKDRFAIGLGLKGEIDLPYVSYFANLGYDIIHGNKTDSRFYQILGTKVKVTDNIFGLFGIRATKFSKAQFIYWSVGYKFMQERQNK